MKIERDEQRFDFHDIGLAIKRAQEASGMTQEQLAYIVDRAPRTIMYHENDGQRNGGCVRRTRGLRFFAPCCGLRGVGKQFGCGHTPKFLLAAGPQKCLLGSSPNPLNFGTNCPEVPVRCTVVCGLSLSFLSLAVIRRGLYFNFFCTFFLSRLLRSRFAYDIIHPKTRRDGAFLPKRRFMLWSIWVFL